MINVRAMPFLLPARRVALHHRSSGPTVDDFAEPWYYMIFSSSRVLGWVVMTRSVHRHGNGGPGGTGVQCCGGDIGHPEFVCCPCRLTLASWSRRRRPTVDLVGCPQCGAVAQLRDRRAICRASLHV